MDWSLNLGLSNYLSCGFLCGWIENSKNTLKLMSTETVYGLTILRSDLSMSY